MSCRPDMLFPAKTPSDTSQNVRLLHCAPSFTSSNNGNYQRKYKCIGVIVIPTAIHRSSGKIPVQIDLIGLNTQGLCVPTCILIVI